GRDTVIGKRPAELRGDFVAVGFRAFGIVRAQIDVDEAPVEAVGNLRAEAIDVIVVAVDAHDARAINGRVQYFGGFEIGRDEDADVKALLCGLRGDGVGQVACRGTANGLEAEAARGGQRRADDAVLKR